MWAPFRASKRKRSKCVAAASRGFAMYKYRVHTYVFQQWLEDLVKVFPSQGIACLEILKWNISFTFEAAPEQKMMQFI